MDRAGWARNVETVGLGQVRRTGRRGLDSRDGSVGFARDVARTVVTEWQGRVEEWRGPSLRGGERRSGGGEVSRCGADGLGQDGHDGKDWAALTRAGADCRDGVEVSRDAVCRQGAARAGPECRYGVDWVVGRHGSVRYVVDGSDCSGSERIVMTARSDWFGVRIVGAGVVRRGRSLTVWPDQGCL